MLQQIKHTDYSTLGELIAARYSDLTVWGGSAPMDMDVSHGVDIEETSCSVSIYPHVKWTDGMYKPCYYWGSQYYVMLLK